MPSCELLPNCAFFRANRQGSDVLKIHWIRTYCRDSEHSERCCRKQYLRKTGEVPPDDLSPAGVPEGKG